MAFSVKVEGTKDLLAHLERIKQSVANRASRKALTKASQIVRDSARAKAPKDTGALRKSIGYKVKTSRRNKNRTYGVVGPRSKYRGKNGNRPARYAHIVEGGSRFRAAKPFLRPAFLSSQQRIQSIVRSVLKDELNKEARKKR